MARTNDGFKTRLGTEVGPSPWVTISQTEIDAFAGLTGDADWLHNDPERSARESPFGTTIVQGFFLLSLFTKLSNQSAVTEALGGVAYALNYGFEHVRFVAPVPVDARVRFRGTVSKIDERTDGRLTLTLSAELEVDGSSRPAVVADWLFLIAPR